MSDEVPMGSKRILVEIDREMEACRSRVEALRQEIVDLEREISRLRVAKIRLGGQGRSEEEMYAPLGPVRPGTDSWLIREHAAQAMRLAGRPLTRKEIAISLHAAKLELQSKNWVRRIGRVLYDSSAFQSTPTGYWLAGEPVPGA